MQSLPPALMGLANYRQFLLYMLVQDGDRLNKIPLNPKTMKAHDAHDPSIWLCAEDAIHVANMYENNVGVAFTFTENDPFWFLDIDNCIDEHGQWNNIALDLYRRVPNAACEISASGRGLHLFGQGSLPNDHKIKSPYGFDLFTHKRFVALTGNIVGAGTVSTTDYTQVMQTVIRDFMPVDENINNDASWSNAPCEEWQGITDDNQLLQAMFASKSAGAVFGGRASVSDLWLADASTLSKFYPDPSREFDHSSADAALCQHLAFWTGKDCERMDRLFRQSGLYRSKWNEREDYRVRTITHAVKHCKKVYGEGKTEHQPKPTESVPMGEIMAPTIRDGFQYLTLQDQIEHFKGCAYIQDQHKIFTPDGMLLKSEQFNATFGGYVFCLDSVNDKTTKNAFEVFTQSQGLNFPKAHSTCFRPEHMAGSIINEESRALVNTYVPVEVESQPGDVTPFLNHLKNLLPEEHDRNILTAYMAACVQHIGIKFQWAPLIQGCEGNGKTLLISCVKAALGSKYTHLPNPNDISNKFNGWLYRKLFIGVEEIYTADRQEIVDTLKQYITNSNLEFQYKGGDQFTGDNRANLMLCSNHKDAIRKDENDRRYCVFYTAQQGVEDLKKYDMLGDYFPNLYGWLNGGGYKHVTDFLREYDIPEELNPATRCQRAPLTTSTADAIVLSRGGVEQEILENVEEGKQGFANGWISSTALTRLLEARRDNKRIPPNKRGEILKGLGYILHPGLKSGRMTTFSPIDDGKPRLYIQKGHLAANLTDKNAIADRYLQDQGLKFQTTTGAHHVTS